jgi:hypothetical protein
MQRGDEEEENTVLFSDITNGKERIDIKIICGYL